MSETRDEWPAGATYVFQGTIAEDATAGTHVCTLTITPGAGSEMLVQGGTVTVGNTATAQAAAVFIDDGTNSLETILNYSSTTASAVYPFPTSATSAATALASEQVAPGGGYLVSGTMRLILRVVTAAVSVTQTFAVVCRIKGAKPTATLNDTIGTSTNTVNTDKVF